MAYNIDVCATFLTETGGIICEGRALPPKRGKECRRDRAKWNLLNPCIVSYLLEEENGETATAGEPHIRCCAL